MLLLLLQSIRHSSRSRAFYTALKQLYRSTPLNLFMEAQRARTCFVFDKDEGTKILIQMIYELPASEQRRKFNLLRAVDEPVSQTVRRLIANIERAAKKKAKRAKKEEETSKPEAVTVRLFDERDQRIEETRTNQEAWTACRKLVINEQSYRIEYNAPAVVKFRFPTQILTNTIVTALAEIDYGDWQHSFFDWYVAEEVKPGENEDSEQWNDDDDAAHWTHVHRGPFCVFGDEHSNKFVRLACLPRNSAHREGMQAVHVSKKRIAPSPVHLPMDTRHQLTHAHFPRDSHSFRFVSYNILANGYACSSDAGNLMYPYCPQDYIEHDYRKPLLLKELLGYHADLLCLQECDTRFFERELSLVLNEHGYLGEMKIKSATVQEGETIFYRKDRFRAIGKHDITIAEYFRDAEQLASLRQRCLAVPEVHASLLERNTVLQLLALQLQGEEEEVFLICNTHLYFHPHADFLRCLQVLVAVERIREIKQFYEQQNKHVSIIWCGDFNANVTSLAFQFLFTGALVSDPNHRSFNADYAAFVRDFDYKTPLELSTYSNYAYTNYMQNFHDVIDHIFFEGKRFQFQRAIPMPSHDEVTEFVALPSCTLPSDHLAVVVELERIRCC